MPVNGGLSEQFVELRLISLKVSVYKEEDA